MTAYEAIEPAGRVPDDTPSTRRDPVGVFYSVTSNDWMETNSAQNIDTYFIPGGNRAFIPGRINYCFKFSCPSCARLGSILPEIHCGKEVSTPQFLETNVLNPNFTSRFDKGYFLSRTGNCKTFDDEADGYCRGEGVGIVIIKLLDDSLADRDPILVVILGCLHKPPGRVQVDYATTPYSPVLIFTKILNQSAMDPYSISSVEMHGT